MLLEFKKLCNKAVNRTWFNIGEKMRCLLRPTPLRVRLASMLRFNANLENRMPCAVLAAKTKANASACEPISKRPELQFARIRGIYRKSF